MHEGLRNLRRRTRRISVAVLVPVVAVSVLIAPAARGEDERAPAHALGNLIVDVPEDFLTIQQAIDATAGQPDGEVRIHSNGTFDETLRIDHPVTIRSAPGFFATVRGANASLPWTVEVRPDGGSGDEPIEVTLRDLRLRPRAGLPIGAAYCVLEVLNHGEAESRILLSGLEIDDPQSASPDGLCVRSNDPTVPNRVRLLDSEIDLEAEPEWTTSGIRFTSAGSLVVSELTLSIGSGRSEGFVLEGRPAWPVEFWLENSNLSVEAPEEALRARLGSISGEVEATLLWNNFFLGDGPGEGSVSGIHASVNGVDGSAAESMYVAIEGNAFLGDEVDGLDAAFSASPHAPGSVFLRAHGNLVVGAGTGFAFNPQAGTPRAHVEADLSNNTIVDSVNHGISLGGRPGSHLMARVANNVLAGSGGFGLDISTQGDFELNERSNDYFENAAGTMPAPWAPGQGSRTDDPRFRAPAQLDYSLQHGSPLIDAGDTEVAMNQAVDANASLRVAHGGVDIGAFEQPAACAETVTTSHSGRYETTGAMTRDRLRATAFDSFHDDWQWVEIDFGCAGLFGALRRFMAADGFDASGARSFQGESVSTSVDGVVWTPLLAVETTGWEAYVNYLPAHWHTVEYGWSGWLRALEPRAARYVRFHWDGNHDLLHEVEVAFHANPPLFRDGFESGDAKRWSSLAP